MVKPCQKVSKKRCAPELKTLTSYKCTFFVIRHEHLFICFKARILYLDTEMKKR